MGRKDFELIAEAVKQSRNDLVYDSVVVDRVASNVAWALTDSNPRFDRERFLKACGVAD